MTLFSAIKFLIFLKESNAMDFLSLIESIIAVILSIVNAFLLTKVSYKFFQILQVSNYHIQSYFIWLKNSKGKFLSRIFMLCFLSLSCLLVTNFIFNNFKDIHLLSYLGLIFYYYFTIVFVQNVQSLPQKKKLTYTKRMDRLVVTCFIFFLASTYLLMLLSYMYTNIFRFCVIALTPLLVPFAIPFCHTILYPVESLIQQGYLVKAKKKLDSMPNLIRIGITGSYAKTSTKDIIKTILEEKYNVCFTPNSYNTPMGIAKTINKRLENNHEIFICEMGATYKMDIAKLVKLVDPQITILTGIANQHILTFKTLENVIETKYEIVKYSRPNALCIFNGNNQNTVDLYNREIENKRKLLIKNDDKNSDFRAENIKEDTTSTTFDLIIKGKNCGKVKTMLHGKYAIENILMAVAVCYNLNLTPQEIIDGLTKCEQTDHRLSVTNTPNGITIIDDSFNANEYGTLMALEYLSLYKGRRKIVMTPGLVDLGEKEREINYIFGQNIAEYVDKCIIVNLNAKEYLLSGLESKNFNKDNIILCDTLEDAKQKLAEILIPGDVLLICNDLPDIYN